MHEDKENQKKNLIDTVNNNPDLQLKIIKYFFPKIVIGKKFKMHEEKTPSSILNFYNGKYWIKNFASDKKGMDCFNLAQWKFSCDESEVIKTIVDNILPEYKFISNHQSKQKNPFEKQLYAIKNNEKKEAEKYLKQRGIKVDLLPKHCFFQNNTAQGNSDAIVFTDKEEKLINKRFFNNSNGVRYNNSGSLNGAIYEKTFNPEADTIYIVEGVINALSLYPEHSSIAIFSTSNYLNPEDLKEYIQERKIIIAFDNDQNKAGNSAADKLIEKLKHSHVDFESIRKLNLPLNTDINDLLKIKKLPQYLKKKTNYIHLYPDYIPDSLDEVKDFEEKGFFIRNSCYYIKENKRGKQEDIEISNFVMKLLFFFPGDPIKSKRIFFLQNSDGESSLMEVSAKDLKYSNIDEQFGSRGGFLFWGTIKSYKLILKDLSKGHKKVKEVEILGHQSIYDIFAFSNGIIKENKFIPVNKFGMVNNGYSTLYIPGLSTLNINSQNFTTSQDFIYEEGCINFTQWASLFCKTFKDKALLGIGFTIGALFRDIIGYELKFFPHLLLFGGAGVGKTTFVDAMIKIFGPNQCGINLTIDSSPKGISRSLSQVKNGFIFLKEMSKEYEKKLESILKVAYELGNSTRAAFSNTNQTISYSYNSGIIIDSNNALSVSSALTSRVNTINFKHQTFTKQETESLNQFNVHISEGIGKVLRDIISQRSHFKKNFKLVFNNIYNKIKYGSSELKDYPERSIKHAVMYMSIYKCLEFKLNFPFSYERYCAFIIQSTIDQEELNNESSEINIFWNTLNTLKNLNKIKSNFFRIIEKDGVTLIALKYHTLYSLYKGHCISQNENSTDKNTLIALLINQKSFFPSWLKGRVNSHIDKIIGSCYLFKLNELPLETELWQK